MKPKTINYKLILCAFSFLLVACDENLFKTPSLQGPGQTDEDYYAEALKQQNNKNYDEVEFIINNSMTAQGRSLEKVKELLAHAYAGQCGMNFLEYVDYFLNTSGTSLFGLFMGAFVGKVVRPDRCLAALQQMDTIAPANDRTNDQKIFAVLATTVYLGANLRLGADISPVNGDGVKDRNVCDNAEFSNDYVDHFILGIGYLQENMVALININALSDIIGQGSVDAINILYDYCDFDANLQCSIKDPADINATQRQRFRFLLNTQELGIGNYSLTSGTLDGACL